MHLLRACHSCIFGRSLNSHGDHQARFTIAHEIAGSDLARQPRGSEAQGCAEPICSL
jgi:hypothetical protein